MTSDSDWVGGEEMWKSHDFTWLTRLIKVEKVSDRHAQMGSQNERGMGTVSAHLAF